MLLKFVGIGILFCLFKPTNAHTWSEWSDCELILSCCRRRVLTCDDGEGLQCTKGGVFEQRVVSINRYDDVCNENMSWLKSARVRKKDNFNYFITILFHVYLLRYFQLSVGQNAKAGSLYCLILVDIYQINT